MSDVTITHSTVRAMSEEDFRKCRRLGLRSEGCIKWDLYNIRHSGCLRSLAVMAKDAEGKVLSWALVDRRTYQEDKPYPFNGVCQIYTRHAYRRKGYGRMVMDRVKDLIGKPHTLPHDERSLKFFRATGVR